MAWCYEYGKGVDRDLIETEAWSRRAFEAGSYRGQLVYGSIVRNRGDIEGAKAIYSVGAAHDWAPANHRLATCLFATANTPEDRRAALTLLERAAEQGSPGARWDLALRLGSGRFGIRQISQGYRLLLQFRIKTREDIRAKKEGKVRRDVSLADMPAAGNA